MRSRRHRARSQRYDARPVPPAASCRATPRPNLDRIIHGRIFAYTRSATRTRGSRKSSGQPDKLLPTILVGRCRPKKGECARATCTYVRAGSSSACRCHGFSSGAASSARSRSGARCAAYGPRSAGVAASSLRLDRRVRPLSPRDRRPPSGRLATGGPRAWSWPLDGSTDLEQSWPSRRRRVRHYERTRSRGRRCILSSNGARLGDRNWNEFDLAASRRLGPRRRAAA